MDFSYIQQKLEYSNAQALVVINFEDSGQPGTRHVSGFSGSASIVVISPTEQYMLSDGRYVSQAKEESDDYKFVSVDQDGYIKSLAKILEKKNIKSILIDATRTHYAMITILQKQLPDIEIKTSHNLLQNMREVKKENEIMLIKQSVDISIRAFEDLLKDIKIGVTERFISARLDFLMKNYGADGFAFDTIVVSGARSALPHGKPTDKKVEKGDLVTIDFGAYKNGFASDITRTIAVGEPNSKLKEIYEIVKNAQQKGCDSVKDGVIGAYVDSVCRNHIADAGYSKSFLHGTGHGLGREVHEQPIINASNEAPLKTNSVITIEPGIYIEGLGGVRIEDDVVVRDYGHENLSEKLSRELVIL